MKKLLIFLGTAAMLLGCAPRQGGNEQEGIQRPKLVVGIVIDQMRPDYVWRYYDMFGKGGFKRLMKQGYEFRNMHYNYVPTYTGPGHTSIYTGTTPEWHGIIANDWYVRKSDSYVYCVEDTTVKSVGSDDDAGQMSPHRLLATTITDELRITSNFQSKVIGISLKDRASILPAGHSPNGAYWYDKKTGDFITSSYYAQDLPQWLKDFNNRKLADKYLNQTWNTVYPIKQYAASEGDNQSYEAQPKGKAAPTFPYDLKALRKENGDFALLPATPFGNKITTDMAQAAIEGEKLGQGSTTDFLALSYSSTDYVGHGFGPQSVEVEDTYIRLDQQLARLFNYLDKSVGKGNYLVFLTADHAAAEVPAYMEKHHMAAGYLDAKALQDKMEEKLDARYGDDRWILSYSNDQFFLNHAAVEKHKLDLEAVQENLANWALDEEGVYQAYTASEMREGNYTQPVQSALQHGYNFKRSGDVLLVLNPAWLHQMNIATSHGTAYNYDTHVPMFWYGWHIPQGSTTAYHQITDVAPTLSMLLHIKLPNASIGKPLEEIAQK